jgi:hypothetical protein
MYVSPTIFVVFFVFAYLLLSAHASQRREEEAKRKVAEDKRYRELESRISSSIYESSRVKDDDRWPEPWDDPKSPSFKGSS